MISLPGKNRTINLMEMEILAGGRNIAGDAKVTSDSEYHSGEYPIKNLTDGNKASMSHSKDGTSNPWIKAAFDAPVALDGLRIWNRGGFEDRFNDAKIEFFNGKKKVASVQVKISGNSGGKDSPFAYDSWIDPPFKTALAHLNNQAIKEKVVINVPAHLKGEARKLYTQGAEIYAREGFCITCHQPDGNGLSAAGFPPLAGSRWVHGSDERIIKIALNGVFGPIEVKGAKYPGLVPMTPFAGMLKDDEIAAVLTYVRNSFGNKGPMVDPAKVKEVRDATKEKVGFYAPDELLKMHPLE
ncbi:MAG: c-type cytochrome [Phycisphaera sp.]|nr:c-type cytochrome [Phycisphaera sp.]